MPKIFTMTAQVLIEVPDEFEVAEAYDGIPIGFTIGNKELRPAICMLDINDPDVNNLTYSDAEFSTLGMQLLEYTELTGVSEEE